MATELKPCPFCGGTKLKIEGQCKTTSYSKNRGLDEFRCSVRCNKCHARGGTASGYTRNALYALNEIGKELLKHPDQIKEKAIEAWNKRAEDGTTKD